MAGKLTNKQKLFIEEYLIDLNATQAAIRAGYSAKTANRMGSENLAKPDIAAEIKRRIDARVVRTEITQDFVLLELLKIAKIDGSVFATISRRGAVKLTATEDLTPEQRAGLASVKKGKFATEIKTYDKLKALELLGKHLGLWEKPQDSDAAPLTDFLKAVQPSPEEVAELYAEGDDDG